MGDMLKTDRVGSHQALPIKGLLEAEILTLRHQLSLTLANSHRLRGMLNIGSLSMIS